MKIGVPKEIKPDENRVGLIPSGVTALKDAGHDVFVEAKAGVGSGFKDEDYVRVGAKIQNSAKEVYETADMIIKVKEPLPSEFKYFKEDQILFTYLHLAAEPQLAEALLESKVTAIAYETIEDSNGGLPLLTPMSEVAGRMAVQMGSRFLEKTNGGMGILPGGVPGVSPARVTILGGGIVGTNAAKIATGMGADVTLLDINPSRLRYLDDVFYNKIKTMMSNSYNIESCLENTDLLIGAVLIPGAKAPKLVTEDMVKKMPEGSVVIDVAVDQGGSIETIDRITTHQNPTYEKHGVIHYAVSNMPGVVPRTSTIALTNATLPYVLKLANLDFKEACVDDPLLAFGVNTAKGRLTYKGVAESLNMEYTPLGKLLDAVKV
ncbi:alanine dehydrogenase [Natranaerofaba carboxydovora]|uniref:alanine dehydrogenase n=1 Tax=Natranaerofaba carboxydovora TaxID=2742683 RepID=UPI001F1492DD|nr:alanine dehydrogenase [Natranaerofaba carboxydovora]UMZ74824.1 Alanine dehydrogenase 2 [Natranaerofaba carboxydovora]